MKPEVKKELSDRYLLNNGELCPVCGSKNIVRGKLSYDLSTASCVVNCDNCDAEWEDVFEVINIIFRDDYKFKRKRKKTG
jgi:transcription elongation factor Elf1